jgi:hypothetical protein
MGVALIPAIFDAPNVKKAPVRDFDAKRVISLHWNKDVADDRLDQVVAFATTYNWASSDRESAARSSRPDVIKSSMRKFTAPTVGGRKPPRRPAVSLFAFTQDFVAGAGSEFEGVPLLGRLTQKVSLKMRP